MDECKRKQAKAKALRLLEHMDRTEHQLRVKLKEQDFNEQEIDEAVRYVESYHYIDDARYAANYIELKAEYKSRRQIEQALMTRGVDRQVIADAFEEYGKIDETPQIEAFLRKKRVNWQEADEKEISKLYQALMRRGFSVRDIRSVIDKYKRSHYNEE
ncbi:regulatory protein RecX [Diplocloster agilis]|uniref:Regulatory protein RecX n=1 Tax=Diplocloster agilis TaxID=2850323 RepID=A0A949NCS8_9FIRM|nr:MULTISPECIES: RecX family transcriptional regulator [Lachnospiraceae]MBU9735196.1 RecX family transcriptional regulator [Diplocloster agilis]MBU9743594.1 RecX family transcriptional regulator [Diplocloster agilis]MCU6733838.1 RecX family transcriptional regulator [Suonthocola fibrivorans]SCJ10699.1 recombination regulator RecX [uncultured Clostridium sp.]